MSNWKSAVRAFAAVLAAASAMPLFAEVRSGSSPFHCSFEDGLGGWSQASNVVIDASAAHAGERSVRLIVKDPKTENVYVSRSLPVEGGARYAASCYVKTEDVRAAEGKDTSVGAGMIVEWADAKGAYLGWGASTYNNFGTRDWFKVESGLLRPPAAASRALVYLCLRGTGKAWFDDFSLEKIDESVPKCDPEDGAVLTNNCPFFSWQACKGVTNYVVQLSRRADFAPGHVVEYAAGGRTGFQVEKPLTEGVWHWKVTATGLDDRKPWRFRQTAPADRDCLPPLAVENAARVVAPTSPFSVHVRETGGMPPTVTFGGRRESCSQLSSEGTLRSVATLTNLLGSVATLANVTGNLWLCTFAAPEGGWPSGLTEGELVASDAAGNRRASRFWLLNAPKPPNAVVIDAKGRYSENGRTIFPLGIYEVAPRHFQTVKAAGFDIVHLYRWESDRDDAACRAYLDGCRDAGLRAFVGFDRAAIAAGEIGHLAHRVGALADHSGLFCWYLYDEPESLRQFIAPDVLADCADLIRRLDPWHPVAVSTWGNAAYRRAWDTHWTQAYGNPVEALHEADRQRARLGDSPVTLLVYCNDDKQALARRLGTPPDPNAFGRDYANLRTCAFLSVVRGCNGVFWWWFAKDGTYYYSAAQSPKAWADLSRVVGELRALRPAIAADGEEETGEDGNGVAWWRKTFPDGRTTTVRVDVNRRTVDVCEQSA